MSCVLWSADGNMYVVAVGTEVCVYDVHTAGIIHTVQLAKKVTCICFCQVNSSFLKCCKSWQKAFEKCRSSTILMIVLS